MFFHPRSHLSGLLAECLHQLGGQVFLPEEPPAQDTGLGGFQFAVVCPHQQFLHTALVAPVGTEMARAVILRHHASLLAGACPSAHDVLAQLKSAGADVDVPISIKNCLCLHVEIFDENSVLFHS